MRWDKGRATIDQMIKTGHLQRVPANREHADELIAEARVLLSLVDTICQRSPRHAYATLYDAARLALTAVLENQGLRPPERGGHTALYEACRAQLIPPMGATIKPFDEMRRERHNAEYPSADSPLPTYADVRDDLAKASAIVDLAERLLDEMDVF